MRCAARCRRATTLAISLPSVVGLAGWPWVRDSIGTPALSCASSVSLAITACSAGSSTVSRAALSIMPCEVLLMSSEVQAKWMNSLAAHQFRHVLDLLLEPVFDRLHVVVGDRFDLLDALGVGFGEVGGDARRAARRLAWKTA